MSNSLRVSSTHGRWKTFVLGTAVCCVPLLVFRGSDRRETAGDSRGGLSGLANPAQAENTAEVDRMLKQLAVVASGESAVPETPKVWSGRDALQRTLALLEDGAALLKQSRGYTATFHRQERVNGELRDPEVVELKLRREPFSVYMRWTQGEPGQELLFIEGENRGKIVLHPSGWKSKLLSAVKVDPHGALARSKSRYPIYEVGLEALADKIINYRKQDLHRSEIPSMRLLDGQDFDGRECYFYIVEYVSPAMADDYRKTLLYIDKESLLPISIRNYTWPEGENRVSDDESTLIEHYVYTDLHIDAPLDEADFDVRNDEYAFHR